MEITQKKLYFFQQMNSWRFNENNGAFATKDFSTAHWYYIIPVKCHVFGKERSIFWMLRRGLDRSCSAGGLGPSHDKHSTGIPGPWLSSLSCRMNLQSCPCLVKRADTAMFDTNGACPPECPTYGVLDRLHIQPVWGIGVFLGIKLQD